MVQVLPYVPSFGEQALPALGNVIGSAIGQHYANKKQQKIQTQDAALYEQLQNPELSPIQRIALVGKMSPESQKTVSSLLSPLLKEQEKGEQRKSLLSQIAGGGLDGMSQQGEFFPQPSAQSQPPGQVGLDRLSNEQLALASTDPTLKPFADQILAQRRHSEDLSHKKFVDARDFAYKEAKPTVDKADSLRETLPNSEAALSVQKAAIQQGDLGFFSKDNLAELLHVEGLRSTNGSLFKAAAKEYFLNNVARVGSRPNQWIEQQLLTMQPTIGRTQAANEAVANFQQFKVDTDRAWLNAYDSLTSRYKEELGYVPGDIGKIVDAAVKPYVDQRQEKLAYQLRENVESEMSPEEFDKLKKVPRGTPLTVRKAMSILEYLSDTEDPEERKQKAEAIAKKLGYTLVDPTIYGAE